MSVNISVFGRYLLERDFPGMRIGPEPTTDNFHVIEWAEEEGKIPGTGPLYQTTAGLLSRCPQSGHIRAKLQSFIAGNVLSVDSTKPFRHLQQFGGTFLSRFESSQSNSEALKSVTLLDTPGILAGEKQLVNRGYDFSGVLKWFAERADRIILLFDAHKLDISDEFKQAIMSVREHDDKIRLV